MDKIITTATTATGPKITKHEAEQNVINYAKRLATLKWWESKSNTIRLIKYWGEYLNTLADFNGEV